jgi:acetolactate synthase-1/2/3 large subunit
MAEGYARSTGKVGVVLVTSGPGATNAVTGLTDALMDSIPIVVPDRPGADAPDRQRRLPGGRHVGITRPCTKHNYLVKDGRRAGRDHPRGLLRRTHGRPGPVVIDIPKDVQFATDLWGRASDAQASYQPQTRGRSDRRSSRVELMLNAKRPIFYTGGGVINSGPARPASCCASSCR